MKKAPNSPRVISSMVAVALLGLIVGSPAWGQELFGTYKVFPGNSTNSNHQAATYAVVPSLDDKAILVFVQHRGGRDKGSFICENAKWKGEIEAYRCDNPMPDDPNTNEILTIGPIAGAFCNDLRRDPKRGGDKILTPAQCDEEGVKCSCYEIKHERPLPVSEVKGAAMGPPSSGAGSGKNN